jgi:DNA-binding CsgD family transcriptional regulator/tetratricopeptide (TPR) repeat protein
MIVEAIHWPLRGRQGYLDEVLETVRAGSSVVLLGEAGVGKSRLAREAAAQLAGDDYFRVWSTSATYGTSLVPFAAFAPFLSGFDGPDMHPLRLFVRISDGLAAFAEEWPLVIVIDDAHLLDDGAATLVHQLATTGRARLIATVRSVEPCVDGVVRLWRDGHARRVVLAPFDRTAVREVLEAALGGSVDALTTARLHARSGGNALFLRELVLEGMATDRLRRSGKVWCWSGPMSAGEGLREVLRARFAELAEDELAAVRLVALAEPVEIDVLMMVADAAVLDRLCRRGLLAEAETLGCPVLGLPHPLYAEGVLAGMATALARQLRLRLAAALDEIQPADGFTVLRRVRLRFDAGERVDDQDLLTAAEYALMLLDAPLAERLARAATADSPQQVMVLARALAQQNRAEQAEEVLARYLRGGAPDESAAVALLRVENLVFKLSRLDESLTLLDDVEKQHGALPAIETGRIAPLTYLGRYQEAAAAFDGAVAGGVSMPKMAFAAGCAALTDLGRQREVIGLIESALAATADPVDRLALRLVSAAAQFYLGELAATERAATELHEWAAATMWPGAMGYAATLSGVVALTRGHYRTALELLRDAATAMSELDVFNGASWPLMALAMCEAACGDHAAANDAVGRAYDSRGPGRTVRFHLESDEVGHAFVLACQGRTHTAFDLLTSIVARCAGKGLCGIGIAAANLLARLGRPRAAERGMAGCRGSVDSVTSTVHAAHVHALARRAPDALLTVSERYEQLTMGHLGAEAADTAADLLAKRSSREAAYARARRDVLLGQCEVGALPWWPSTPGPSLTPREREVAQLAAYGLTNPRIAEQLYVSVRTVENHLQRAYAKLGITTREQLPTVLDTG